MTCTESDKLTDLLKQILGLDNFIRLCQEFGGTRLYVPHKAADEHEIVQAIGESATRELISAFSPDTIRVPLARDDRAIYYRKKGLSHAAIARKLGITENGVSRLLQRIERSEVSPSSTS